MMRLDKFLSEQNIASRSQLKQAIKKGMAAVNGEKILKPEFHINPEMDLVTYMGKPVIYEPFRYYMLNKPKGVVSATEDKREQTVLDLLPKEIRKDLFPAGRLDKDTEGLLLLTNDGQLAHDLLSPRKHVEKTYFVRTDRPIPAEGAEALEKGIDIGEKHLTLPAKVICSKQHPCEAWITIHEGKFHQIKRMFQTLDLTVISLKRLTMGSLTLDDALSPGDFRSLTSEEVSRLKGLTEYAEK